jgi:hypothetical protein
MLSMAAGAWQGTTAQSEQPGSSSTLAQGGSTQLTLRGCVQKGQAAGTYLLITPDPLTETGLDPASISGAPPKGAASSQASSTPGRPASAAIPSPVSETVTYELVAAGPAVDLASLVGKRVTARGTPERTAKGATADDGPAAAAAAADTPSGNPPGVGTTGAHARSAASPQRSRVRVTAIEPDGGPCQ